MIHCQMVIILLHLQWHIKIRKKRKYVKYERSNSNSSWHIDWTGYNKNEKLIIIEDDASRFIVGLGVYSEETIDNTINTLIKAIELYAIAGVTILSPSDNESCILS